MDEVENVKKLWKRLKESLDDDSGQRGIHRLVNNAEMLAAYMECNDVLKEATNSLSLMNDMNKKINLSTHNRTVDNALVFILLKGLTTIPSKTKAFRLGLIDRNGKLLRKPKTKEENDCISNLDLIFFKLQEWLRPRIQYLSSISWIKSVMNDVRPQNYFSNTEVLAKQYCVLKLNQELDKILKF